MNKKWEIKKLGEVCDVEYGTRVVQKRDGGSIYPVYGGGGATFFMDTFNRENNLVVARFAMSAQCTRYVKGKFFLNDSGLTIKPKNKEELSHDFLNLQMVFLNDIIYSLGRGTAQKNLDVDAFRNLEVIYPKSLPEQQRIVSILDECFSAIERSRKNAEQSRKNAKELFESYLQGVFGSAGSPTEEQRVGWNEKKLGEMATFRNGINYTKSSKGEKIKIVGVKDFQENFWIPFDELDSVVLDGKLSETDELKENDIIAVRSNGNPALIGRTLLAGDVAEKISHSGFTIRIRLISNEVLPIYLCRYLKTKKTRKVLVEKGNGVGIKSLNQGSLSSLSIPFPKSKVEQQHIVRQLDTFRTETQKLEAIYQKKIANLDELNQSILAKAFRGELTEKK